MRLQGCQDACPDRVHRCNSGENRRNHHISTLAIAGLFSYIDLQLSQIIIGLLTVTATHCSVITYTSPYRERAVAQWLAHTPGMSTLCVRTMDRAGVTFGVQTWF